MDQEPCIPRRSKTSKFGCLLAVIGALTSSLLLVGIIIFLAIAWATTHAFNAPIRDAGSDEAPDLTEIWAYGQGDCKTVLIPLRGMIQMEEESGFFGPSISSTAMALRSIHRATRDPEVMAIILDIDSGGGGITASDVLYNALLKFRNAREGRKIVALYGDVAASGAYYISLAADHIMAHPTSITGSIGVLIQSLNLSELGSKIGIKDVTIASGENKSLLNPLHEMTPEQRRILQVIVDAMHQRFVGLVASHRHIEVEAVKQLADGRIFTSDQAVSERLIDSIGYWDDAMLKTSELLGVNEIKVFRYDREFSLSSFLNASESWHPNTMMERMSRTRLLYSWSL